MHALYDGDRIEPWETVMAIEGDYTLFAHLETVYLGVLARRTLISTNVTQVLEAARASRSSSCRPGTTTTASRPATATPRTSPGARRRGDRCHDRRAGVVVGRPRHRHGAARADRLLRREHGLAATQVRRVGAAGLQHRRARRLRERLRADRARGRARAQGPSSGASGSTPPASSSTARLARDRATSTRAA